MFEEEILLIENEQLRKTVDFYMKHFVPDYFFHIGASATGKFHPLFAQGEGGLVRHTKAVVKMAKELFNLSSYGYMPQEYKDYVIAACIMHDTCKYGNKHEMCKEDYKEHGNLAADNFVKCWHYLELDGEPPELLLMAIRSHMGQWGNPKPFTNIDRCVHMADYIVSRNFVNIDLGD